MNAGIEASISKDAIVSSRTQVRQEKMPLGRRAIDAW
jgi:hypothetical protein